MIREEFTLNQLKDAVKKSDKVLVVNKDLVSLLKDRREAENLSDFGVLTALLTTINDREIKISFFFKKNGKYILFREENFVFKNPKLLDRLLMRGE